MISNSSSKSGFKKANRFSFLPYDPILASSKDESLPMFGEFSIRPGKLNSSLLFSPKHSTAQSFSTPNAGKINHLLSRASFGATVAEMQSLGSLSPNEVVEMLLQETALPAPPGEWVSEPFDRQAYRNMTREERQAWRRQNRQRINELRAWWVELMTSSPLNLNEKMTLFWHGHFTTDFRSAQFAQFLYIQNDTLRRNALGNLGTFLKEIYKDPAMLLYLNGVQNRAQQPNENFARELLELFTIGVGNYTEQDIKEGARALTGWQINELELKPFLNQRRYDDGVKIFLGQTGNFTADDIIDIILEQPQTAKFICRKFYEFFISREVNEGFITELAETFRSNSYEIKPVLEKLFTSDLFYSNQAVASLIKSPVDMAITNARMLSVDSIDLRYLLNATRDLNQELLNPPNVAGWPGQRDWISPTTYVTRNTFSETYVNGGLYQNPNSRRSPIEFDPLAFAKSFNIQEVTELAEAMATHLLALPVQQQNMDFLVSVLLGSAEPGDWSLDYPGADRLVTEFLIQLLRLPEFHLN